MSSRTPIDPALKRAAALRGEIAAADREQSRALAGKSWLGRRLRVASVVLTLVLGGVLIADAVLAYDAFFRSDAATNSADPTEPTYKDLEVFERDGRFAGRITLVNPLDRDVELFVEVDMYDGDQNVGEIGGHVTLKPDSESVLELTGFDDYAPYTESRVNDFGWVK